MEEEQQTFKEKYKIENTDDLPVIEPRRENAVKTFKKLIKRSVNDDITDIWLKAMAAINLEMERRFANAGITFEPPSQYSKHQANAFSLIQRQKSKRSTKKKKKENIANFDEKLEEAVESNDERNIPTNIRHIFDLYGLKLICPNVQDPQLIISTVIKDILIDIEESSPKNRDEAKAFRANLNYMSLGLAVDFIVNTFPDKYPNLRKKLDKINEEQKQANEIQAFLNSKSDSVSNLTYNEYYQLILDCQKALLDLSYKEDKLSNSNEEDINDTKTYNERKDIKQNIKKLQQKLDYYALSGEGNQLIKKADFERFSSALRNQLNMVASKRTNKIDLSIGDLMFFDVITTSKALKNLGITWSDDITRNKLKRNPNGYIANFYSLDGPNGIHAEMQVQSLYRYYFGEIGPAAHNKMPGKKRILYSPKKHHRKKWFRNLTNSIARRSICLGNGEIKVNNLQEDFYEQYKPRTDSQLEIYRKFMRKQFKNIYKFINAYRGNIIKYQFNENSTEVNKISELELTPDFIEDATPFNPSIDDVMEL